MYIYMYISIYVYIYIYISIYVSNSRFIRSNKSSHSAAPNLAKFWMHAHATCHAYKFVVPYVVIRHITRMNERHVIRIDNVRHTCE